MSDWNSIIQDLQTVETAQEDFLLRHFVDEHIIGPFLLDRVAEDLSRVKPRRLRIGLQPAQPTSDDDEQ